MTKNEFLQRICEGINTEESAISIYLEHLNAIVARSGLPVEKIKKLRNGIEYLVAENKKHKKLLEGLKFQVESGDTNVY